MSKKNKIDKKKENTVKSINNNIRSSVRKLNPILKGIVGKKVLHWRLGIGASARGMLMT